MYAAIIDGRPAFGGRIQVQSIRDIEYLVKEAEIVTGQPGREFSIACAYRLTYWIRWFPAGYEVRRCNTIGRWMTTRFMRPERFAEHNLGVAATRGCLFTALLPSVATDSTSSSVKWPRPKRRIEPAIQLRQQPVSRTLEVAK